MNHMIHNLTPTPDRRLHHLRPRLHPRRDRRPRRAIKDVRTVWIDVIGRQVYPVFDVHKGARRPRPPLHLPGRGAGCAASAAARPGRSTEDGVLVGTAGHLHPGGLWTDLKLTRDGRTVRLFRSQAKYFEPAGAVSWDVAMTATPEDWRVGVAQGRRAVGLGDLRHEARLLVRVDGDHARRVQRRRHGPRPVRDQRRRARRGHARPPARRTATTAAPSAACPTPRRLLAAPPARSRTVPVSGFLYGQGDLGLTGRKGRPPTIRPGQTLSFVNRDAKRNIFHTITSCKAPCNGATGIAYPLANGPVRFDSGNLGFGPEGRTAAAQRITWRTPKKIRPGTYTYFCRVHPFMRGAFRVAASAASAALIARRAGPSAPRPAGRSPRARAAPARTWRSSPHDGAGRDEDPPRGEARGELRPRQRGRRSAAGLAARRIFVTPGASWGDDRHVRLGAAWTRGDRPPRLRAEGPARRAMSRGASRACARRGTRRA